MCSAAHPVLLVARPAKVGNRAVAAVLVYFLTAYHGREVIEISDARTVKVQRVTETI